MSADDSGRVMHDVYAQTDQPVPAATLDYTPLTDDEEAALRASIEDLARFPAHTDWVNTIASLFGSLDAARLAPAPTAPAGLRSVVDITGIDAIRAAVIREMEDEGVVTWGDEGHRARFLAIAAPPQALPVDGLREALEGDVLPWLQEDRSVTRDDVIRRLRKVLAYTAIASPSEEPGLDVERLARAIDHHVHASYDVMQLNPDHLSYYSLASCGEAIAAEYARLRETP